MPAFILGGIYGGVMTPTEAAGVAVIYAIPIGFFVYKGLNRDNFWSGPSGNRSVTIGVVMVMVFMVLIVSRFLIFEDIPGLAKDTGLLAISDNPIVILLMVNVVMILIGMVMDDISAVCLLSAPLLLPIVHQRRHGPDPLRRRPGGQLWAWPTSPRRPRLCSISALAGDRHAGQQDDQTDPDHDLLRLAADPDDHHLRAPDRTMAAEPLVQPVS